MALDPADCKSAIRQTSSLRYALRPVRFLLDFVPTIFVCAVFITAPIPDGVRCPWLTSQGLGNHIKQRLARNGLSTAKCRWGASTKCRPRCGHAAHVAQIWNLPYRRIASCRALAGLKAVDGSRPCRLQVGDTADFKSALRSAPSPLPSGFRSDHLCLRSIHHGTHSRWGLLFLVNISRLGQLYRKTSRPQCAFHRKVPLLTCATNTDLLTI